MDAFSLWLAKAALTPVAAAILRKCANKGLLATCEKRAEEWRSQLPPEAELISVETFFNTQPAFGIHRLPKGPTTVAALIEQGNVPTAANWLEDLVEQWRWVRENIEDPTAFFKLDADAAKQHLDKLAQMLTAECVKDPLLFQQDIYKAVHGMHGVVRNINAQLATLPDQLAATTTQLVSKACDAIAASSTGSNFDSEIDAACVHTKSGHPQLTKAALDELEKRHWHALSQHSRYRLTANRGIALVEMGDDEAGARQYIACAQYESNEEKPRCWAANGHLILGDRAKCASLVQGILTDYPESAFAYALRVYSAPSNASFSEVENLVPKHHRDDSEIAMALSLRAKAGRLMEFAEKYARAACKDDPHPKSLCHLGALIIDSTILRGRTFLSESPPVDEDRLREGIEMLEAAVKAFESRGDKPSTALCHFHIGRAFHFLGDDDRSASKLKLAYTMSPDQPSFCTQYALALYDSDREDEAINLLEDAAPNDETLNASTLAAKLLRKRNSEGDVDRAIKILEVARTMFPGEFSSANIEFIGVLVESYCAAGRQQVATNSANALARQLDETECQVVLAGVDSRTGNPESANARISAALKLVSADTDIWTRHAIADELRRLNRYEEAFAILRDYVPENCMSLDTQNLIYTAQKCERDGFLIEFLLKLRVAGVFDPQFVDLELGLLERYHAGETSIKIIQSLLEKQAGDEEFRSELRVRLSFLGFVYGHDDLVENNLLRLPRADATSPYVGFLVVQLLVHQNRFEEARVYAYTLLRCHFESADAHKALIGAYLLEQDAQAPIPPAVVAPGTAITYIEDGICGESYAIIEDNTSPDIERHEYAPTHHIFKNALGKKVGERFTLKDSGFQQIHGTILNIDDKRIFRFNRCMQEYDRRFDDGFLIQVRIPKDEDGNLDLTPMRNAAKERAEQVAQQDEVYRTYPLSATSYANLSKTSLVDVIGHFANEKLPVPCCGGSAQEHEVAFGLLRADARLVVDPSAVETLVHTDAHDLLQTLPVKLIVPRGLIIRLRASIESQQRFSGAGVLSYIDSQLVFEEVTQEQKDIWLRKLDDTVKSLESAGEIVDGLALANTEPKVRKRLVQIFGWDTAEAIAAATQLHASVWTDDRLVAELAKSQASIERVWSEVLFQWAESVGRLHRSRSIAIISRLVTLGYRHTKLMPDIAVYMAEDSNWDFRREPFRSAIDWLGDAGVSAEAIRVLAENLLPRVYGKASEMLANMTVLEILRSIGRRRDGRQIVRELRRRVGIYCRWDFASEGRLTQDLDTWLNLTRNN